jgi:CRISPR-associated endonuclease Cas2
MAGMSSKRAGAVASREILRDVLSLIATGKLAEVPSNKCWYLKRLGYLGQNGTNYYLLPKGRRALSESKIWSLTLPTPKQWDGKWRLVMFDIPADKRKRRDAFRLRLKELGLVLYQHSVWIYPYPIEETIQQIADFYKLSNCISFIVAEKINGEKKLQQQFKL